MDRLHCLWTLLILLGVFSHIASTQSFRIPNSGDNCNVVNLNFGQEDGPTSQRRGPQGPPGKQGIPGILGIKGDKGSKGEVGPLGITPEINTADIVGSVFKALGASSCGELMKIHGMQDSGYYLMRSRNGKRPVYAYCDFQLREEKSSAIIGSITSTFEDSQFRFVIITCIESCQQIRTTLRQEMTSGYFLIRNNDTGEMDFHFCSKDSPKDCKTVKSVDAIVTNDTGGVFDIFPVSEDQNVRVYCDLKTDGGGWTVFQRRMDGSVDFYRDWNDYVNGFGTPDREFWLGLENLHEITNAGEHELRIDISDWSGNSVYAKYGTFSVGTSHDNYRLDVGSYSGTAGDSLAYHDNMQFTTRDADHDSYGGGNCALHHFGGWWYNICYYSNLNGIYHQSSGTGEDGVVWRHWKNDFSFLKSVEMKLRKKG